MWGLWGPLPRGCPSRASGSRAHVGGSSHGVSSPEGSPWGPFHRMILRIIPGYVASKPRIFLEILRAIQYLFKKFSFLLKLAKILF